MQSYIGYFFLQQVETFHKKILRTHNHFVVFLSHTHTKVKEDGRKFLEVIFVALIVVMVSLICLPSMLLSHLVLSDSATPWTAARQASLFFTISWSLLKLMSIESVIPPTQPSHPLSSPFPLAFNLPQHQGLFQWVSSSHQLAKVLKFQLQHQSFQWIFSIDFL